MLTVLSVETWLTRPFGVGRPATLPCRSVLCRRGRGSRVTVPALQEDTRRVVPEAGHLLILPTSKSLKCFRQRVCSSPMNSYSPDLGSDCRRRRPLRDCVVWLATPVAMEQRGGSFPAVGRQVSPELAFAYSHDLGRLGPIQLIFQHAVEYL